MKRCRPSVHEPMNYRTKQNFRSWIKWTLNKAELLFMNQWSIKRSVTSVHEPMKHRTKQNFCSWAHETSNEAELLFMSQWGMKRSSVPSWINDSCESDIKPHNSASHIYSHKQYGVSFYKRSILKLIPVIRLKTKGLFISVSNTRSLLSPVFLMSGISKEILLSRPTLYLVITELCETRGNIYWHLQRQHYESIVHNTVWVLPATLWEDISNTGRNTVLQWE